MEVVSNSVHRQLTLPRAVCLAVSARVAPEDVSRVATANQAFTIITIMLIIISIILPSQSFEINHYIQILPQRMWPGLQLHIKLYFPFSSCFYNNDHRRHCRNNN